MWVSVSVTTLPPPLIRLDGAYELSVKAVAADTLISQRILRAVHVTIAYQWPLADDDSPLTCSSELIRHSRRNTESNETWHFHPGGCGWMWVDGWVSASQTQFYFLHSLFYTFVVVVPRAIKLCGVLSGKALEGKIARVITSECQSYSLIFLWIVNVSQQRIIIVQSITKSCAMQDG